jgi:hypothetical protein
MTNRLPIPGGDLGDWGDILNSFLEVSLASDGTLNSNTVGSSQLATNAVATTNIQASAVTASNIANGAVGTNQLASNAVTNAQLDTPTQTTLASVANKYTLPNGGIPYTDLAGNIPASSLSTAVQTNLSSATTAIQPTTTLAGDLSGSLPSPTVAKLQGISLPSSTPTAGQVLQATSGTATNWATVTSSGTVNNATTTTPGLIELAGDLGGTNSSATSPTLANTTNVENIISSNSTVAGATQKTNNLSDLTSVTTARTNLGLGTASTISSTAGGDLSGTLPNPTVAKLQGTTISSPTGGATSYLNATGTWTTPSGGGSSSNATANTPGLVQLDGDLGGSATSPSVTSIKGITLPSSAPTTGNVLTASSSSATTWSTPAAGVTLDSTAADIQPLGTRAAGSIGKAADAGHVHAMPSATQVGALPSTDDLSTIASTNATSANVSLNSFKITGLANGTAATDAAAFGQIPNVNTTAVGGDLSGTVGSATVATIGGYTPITENTVMLGDLSGTLPNSNVVSTHLSSALPIAQGGTGSGTQNFVDLSTGQSIAGAKNFTGSLTVNNQAVSTAPTVQANKTGSYTLALSDANTIVPFTASTASTVTIPTNANVAFPAGTVIYIENYFSAPITLAAQSGVNLYGERVSLPITAVIMLLKQATNTWIVSSLNNNQRLLPAYYYPEDYGVIGAGNDTAAIQAAIDAATANGGGTVVLKGQGYTLTSSPRTDRGGNSVLALPNASATTVSILGVNGLTTITCSLTGLSYSATYGSPSVIGGPTPEQNGGSSYKVSSNVFIDNILVAVANNPTYSGIDLVSYTHAVVSNVTVETSTPGVQPTYAYSFGLRLPSALNYGIVEATNTLISGFYFGHVIYQSHTILTETISNLCYVAYGLTSGTDTHATIGVGVQWQECKYGMTGYSTTGIVSLASAFYINLPLLDLEDGATGNWYSSPIHILDASNQIRGEISYSRTLAGVGAEVGALTVTGASNLTMRDLNANSIYATPSMSTNWNAVTTVGSTTTLIPLRYKKDRNGLVRLEGTFSKSSVALSSGEVAFTLPTGFRPSGGLYFSIVTDTGSGAIKYDGQNPGNFVWISGGSITSGTGFMTISAIYEGLA